MGGVKRRKVSDAPSLAGEEHEAILGAVVRSSAHAVVMTTTDGRITGWNPAAERIFDYPAHEAIGAHISMLLPAGHHEKPATLAEAVGSHTGTADVVRRRKDGSLVDVSLVISPILGADGQVLGMSGIALDITDRRRAERELDRLAQAAEHATDAVVSVDLDGVVRHWSPGAERLYGISERDALGLNVEQFNALTGEPPEADARGRDALARILAGEEAIELEVQRRRADGTPIDILVVVAPWLIDGRVAGMTMTHVDITERRRAERERERALKELNLAQRAAKLGSWSWCPETGETLWSEQMYGIFGREPPAGPFGGEDILEVVHPEDRGRVAAAYDAMRDGGPGFELDFRIVVGSRELAIHAASFRSPTTSGWYMGTVQDLTHARAIERAARAAEERFRSVFERAPVPMALMGPDGRIEAANEALSELCGRSRASLQAADLRSLLAEGAIPAGVQLLHALARGERELIDVELGLQSACGARVDVLARGIRLAHADNQPVRVLCSFMDVTERNSYEAQLQHLALHDPLTGLANRRHFEAELDRHVAHVARYGPEGALLLLDIDHFKRVNDTLGHTSGDELIIQVADVLRGRLRASDLLARLGGDEFAALLPKADSAEAERVAQEIVKAVREHTAMLGSALARVTVSVGVAAFDRAPDLSTESMVVHADLAMYDAKDAGRDGYAIYRPPTERDPSHTQTQLALVHRIERALTEDGFVLLAQPVVDLRSGQVAHHELLVRMRDGGTRLLAPDAFMRLAERFGLAGRIDCWVCDHAIALLATDPDLRLEVNICGRSLVDPELSRRIDEQLARAGVEPARLIFDVSEASVAANLSAAHAFAEHVHGRGCRVALGGYGSSLGSFQHLRSLPLDFVKIDRDLVHGVCVGEPDRLVIEAIVTLARGLGAETVAEFVQDAATQALIARLGVDYAQGYEIGRPHPVSEALGAARTHP